MIRTSASVLLVNYAGYPSSPNSLMPDNGLASLASRLVSAGHRAKILDYSTVSTMRRLVPEAISDRLGKVFALFEEQGSSKTAQAIAFAELKVLAAALKAHRAIEEIKIAGEIAALVESEGADLVGFKLWNGDGFTGPARMARYLKERFPGLLIAAGGPQVKFFKDFIFAETQAFDALSIGDGEAMILPLAEASIGGKLSDVPNIFYMNGGRAAFTRMARVEDMDSLPFPAYGADIYPSLIGDDKIKILVVEDRRGCDNLCRFCVHPAISGEVPRIKSPERVVSEFRQALELFGIGSFRLGGSSSPSQGLLQIAREVEKGKLPVIWTAFSRIKDSDPAAFSYLRENGLFGLFFGIESGSQKVLDGMNKGVSPEEIKKVILAAKEAGIFTAGSVIYPAPFDTQETRRETMDLILEARPDSVPLQFLGIYPGTEYSRDPERYGLEITYPSVLSRLLQKAGLKKKASYSDPEVMRYLLNYKINLLFPPKYWEPLPWKINGMEYGEYALKTQEFYEELKRNGIVSMLTDEEAMMARLAGYSPRSFADAAFECGFTGDWAKMQEIVRRINSGIMNKR